MKRIVMLFFMILLTTIPVSAIELEAPVVPSSGRDLMPSEHESFTEGLLEVLTDALGYLQPDLKEASGICFCTIAAVMIVAVLQSFHGMSGNVTDLAGSILVATLLLRSTNSLIHLGMQTVGEISEYGKLLLPVMTTAMAAQGGVTAASALYAGTAFFDAVLTSLISKILTPMVYLFLSLAAACSAVGEEMLIKVKDAVKWAMTWTLKIILYVFTGYISITGVVSGTTDAAALKAAKLTISGVVPVVGGILSDASEAVLVSAGTVKNAMGVYGLLAVVSVWLGPFIRIGAHYLMIKLTAGVCGIIGSKRLSGLIRDFAGAMGFVLAMTGAVCLMLMVSTVCYMKGMV
ncbi:MAG: stage III sporulation protein AE [Oscillospiraceae bacterium]|nr:stage III sporulation protein AE [Oscillospiraceae bacterium]